MTPALPTREHPDTHAGELEALREALERANDERMQVEEENRLLRRQIRALADQLSNTNEAAKTPRKQGENEHFQPRLA